MTPTRVSSLLTLIGISCLYGINRFYELDTAYFSSLIFGATFVGMCSHKVIKDYQVIISSLIYSMIYVYLAPQSFGIGGALGLSAFASLLFVLLISRLFKASTTFK